MYVKVQQYKTTKVLLLITQSFTKSGHLSDVSLNQYQIGQRAVNRKMAYIELSFCLYTVDDKNTALSTKGLSNESSYKNLCAISSLQISFSKKDRVCSTLGSVIWKLKIFLPLSTALKILSLYPLLGFKTLPKKGVPSVWH